MSTLVYFLCLKTTIVKPPLTVWIIITQEANGTCSCFSFWFTHKNCPVLCVENIKPQNALILNDIHFHCLKMLNSCRCLCLLLIYQLLHRLRINFLLDYDSNGVYNCLPVCWLHIKWFNFKSLGLFFFQDCIKLTQTSWLTSSALWTSEPVLHHPANGFIPSCCPAEVSLINSGTLLTYILNLLSKCNNHNNVFCFFLSPWSGLKVCSQTWIIQMLFLGGRFDTRSLISIKLDLTVIVWSNKSNQEYKNSI